MAKTRKAGAVASLFYAAHAAELLWRTAPENLLWSCNFASAAVALGLLLGSPVLNGAGGLLLLVGEPLWIDDLVSGGMFLPTSLLTHLGLVALSLLGMRTLGLPRYSCLLASAILTVATGVSRVASSEKENVNLSRHIPAGWEFFPSHGLYLLFLGAVLSLALFGVEGVLRWSLRRLRRDRTDS